ncbi:DUF3489 domain-containing protein [Sphingomonas flavalba]|uniref:DUF3489 domain-containing protein n=1 Tax=Sphingomonas flavalba TaxID=2559804 RepID=UPI00109D9C84|nr:DUF3489 domain-containing protein [Sphingomonas flavalba]
MTKLTDTQLILLSTAAGRSDSSLLPPPDTVGAQGASLRKAVATLVKRGLATEITVMEPAQEWRREDDRRIGVAITDTGRAAIFVGAAAEPPATASASPAPGKPASKIALVVALLQRADGASLAELVEATGWLPHATRAALSGLRKKGHVVAKDRRDDSACYRIAADA